MSDEKRTEGPLFGDQKMKPMIILPPDAMSAEDVDLLRANGLCVVVAKEPSLVKFMDPIPAVSSRTAVENAAIQLSRKIIGKGYWTSTGTRESLAALYVDLLVAGTSLDPRPSKQEREQEIFDVEKAEELRRLARQEAKAERDAAFAAKKKVGGK